MQITKTFQPKTTSNWRSWLSNNNDSEQEIWVVLFKKSSGKQTVTYLDLLDEALCFGWIDTMEKSIDAETYAVRFTPRKNIHSWSELNKKRYQELLAEGLVTEAGKKAYLPT